MIPERCADCGKDASALSEDEARALHAQLEHWKLEFPQLRRNYVLKDFRQALALLNRIGMLAEEQGHHPDFHLTSWNKLELVLSTHSVGGLTLNDFALARLIERLEPPR
jgi:4a-hydroxytetrahydrobiopterin dehydratase